MKAKRKNSIRTHSVAQ